MQDPALTAPLLLADLTDLALTDLPRDPVAPLLLRPTGLTALAALRSTKLLVVDEY